MKIELEGYFDYFAQIAETFPGDESMRNYFLAFAEERNNERVRNFVKTTVEVRPELDPKNWVLLATRATQYSEYFLLGNREYASYRVNEWKEYLKEVTDPQSPKWMTMTDIMRERSVNTHFIARYRGPQLIAQALFPSERVNILDVGGSAGIGVAFVSINEQFDPIVDYTPDRVTDKFGTREIRSGKVANIDKADITDMDWIAACTARFNQQKLMDELKRKKRDADNNAWVVYKRMDICDPHIVTETIRRGASRPQIQKRLYEVTMAVNSLYQLPDSEFISAFKNMTEITGLKGVVIVQDFVGLESASEVENSNDPCIPLSMLGVPNDERFMRRYQELYRPKHPDGTYRTVVFSKGPEGVAAAWEVFRFDHARVNELYPGSDYDPFFKFVDRRNAGAAVYS